MDKEDFKKKVYIKYENELNKREKNKYFFKSILQKVAVLFIVTTCTITVYAGVSGKIDFGTLGLLKLSENYEENAIQINQGFENEYLKMTLESMSGDEAYIIADYKIEFKDKALNELKNISYDTRFGYNLLMDQQVIINSEKATYVMENVNKLSDYEYRYTQVINVMDIYDDKLKLEIKFETLHIGSYGEGFDDINIGKIIETEIIQKKDNENEIEQILNDNTRFIIQNTKSTKFENFVKIKKITENITWQEYENENYMQYDSYIVVDEDNKLIKNVIYSGNIAGKKYYIKKEGNYIPKEKLDEEANAEIEKRIEQNEKLGTHGTYSYNGYIIKNDDVVMVEENIIILLGVDENIDNIRIIPIKTHITNEKRDVFDNTTWYPLIAGDKEYTKKSDLGGEVKINKIEIDNKNITFYYDTEGIIEKAALVVIRNNNGKMNYIYSTSEESKGIIGSENKIVFDRNDTMKAGLETMQVDLSDLNNLEFAILFGVETEVIGETIKLNKSTQNMEIDEIENIKILDLN